MLAAAVAKCDVIDVVIRRPRAHYSNARHKKESAEAITFHSQHPTSHTTHLQQLYNLISLIKNYE